MKLTINTSAHVISALITLPYYRFYRENTLLPIQGIAEAVKSREEPALISAKFHKWTERKLREYQFVQVAVSASSIRLFSPPGLPLVRKTIYRLVRCQAILFCTNSLTCVH